MKPVAEATTEVEDVQPELVIQVAATLRSVYYAVEVLAERGVQKSRQQADT